MLVILALGASTGLATYVVEPEDLVFGLIFESIVLAAFIGCLVL
jgi:hypothetical protein